METYITLSEFYLRYHPQKTRNREIAPHLTKHLRLLIITYLITSFLFFVI